MIEESLLQRLCLLLAFQSMMVDGKKVASADTAKRIIDIARHMEKFCNLNIVRAFPSPSIADTLNATQIDEAIGKHLNDLRQNNETRLPESLEMLLAFYDRLQQRKTRRMQREFYASTTEERLADAVLRLLDEELEEAESLS